MLQRKIVGKIKARFMLNNLFSSIVPFMRLNGKIPQVTIRRTDIACWIPKATNTLSEFVILIVYYCKDGCTNVP
jgi:hypothetical protein